MPNKESNWLLAPTEEYSLYIRTYGPGESIVKGDYKAPPVVPVK